MTQGYVQASEKARSLFNEAKQANEAQDYDRAIDGYIKGLRLEPELMEAHIELRLLALNRRERGGDAPTAEEIAQHTRGSNALDLMLGAEYLLSKHPEYLPYADLLLRYALTGQYLKTAAWIADLMFLANNRSSNPSAKLYKILKDAYLKLNAHDRALSACQKAWKLDRNDTSLRDELKAMMERQKSPVPDHEQTTTPQDTDPESDEPNETSDDNTQEIAAKLFFDKAIKAAEAGNYDYAIDLYIDGLKHSPEDLERGHLPLCRLGLQRQGKGGKRPSMVDRAKGLRAKNPLDQMLNAERLFAKDPSHLPYAEAMLKAAVNGGYHQTAHWIANLIYQTNNSAEKPSFQTFMLLKDMYKAMGIMDKAVVACQRAVHLHPDDEELGEEFKFLSAELTMARGRYDQEGDFRKAIVNAQEQEYLYAQDRVVKTEDWKALALEKARKAYAQNSQLPKNIYHLADALADLKTPESTDEALKLLEKAYQDTKNFAFQEKAGNLRIKSLRHQISLAKDALKEAPDDDSAQAKLDDLNEKLLEIELVHYQQCMDNNPTHPKFKYELALRLMAKGQYDQAIPLFQETQKDPARRVSASSQIGQCFLRKGWHADAVDMFNDALENHETKDDRLGKELRYYLGLTYEEMDKPDAALEVFRKLAQTDFNYRDVSERVSKLRQTGS